ncbi:DUF3152 domain-containing protein [Streptomyces sp. NPDC088729]|uniref:DUF3152 domain-containing protein n=1 Tax=Streptomyces sp. NPDC088729 TaxID=3365876 RepID=UPI00382DF1CA
MGRHSRKGPGAVSPDASTAQPGGERGASAPAAGSGRRRRVAPATPNGGPSAPFPDAPHVRGGHPEQHEPGGGWGTGPQPRAGEVYGAPAAAAGAPSHDRPHPRPAPGDGAPAAQRDATARQRAVARQVSAQREAQRVSDGRTAQQPAADAGVMPGPRREFIDAFDADAPTAGPDAPGEGPGTGADGVAGGPGPRRDARGGWGRTLTGIAAAVVTAVLAVVVAGQVADDSARRTAGARATGVDRDGSSDASRSDARSAPEHPASRPPEVKPLSYADRMARPYPLSADLTADGEFDAVPGLAEAPGEGRKYRYRVDVEEGLGLDAGLFAEAVQKTLNDDRSWAHDGAMTFERISTGSPDFVITLASPGTTGAWCAKSGLDTTIDNVSCDSAATDRVMINAYRWAQGSATFGPDKMLSYRQMLINHEVGHRLGHNHVSCRTPGALAPVMQQQTKSLDLEGIRCEPNPWAHPGG